MVVARGRWFTIYVVLNPCIFVKIDRIGISEARNTDCHISHIFLQPCYYVPNQGLLVFSTATHHPNFSYTAGLVDFVFISSTHIH